MKYVLLQSADPGNRSGLERIRPVLLTLLRPLQLQLASDATRPSDKDFTDMGNTKYVLVSDMYAYIKHPFYLSFDS